MLLLIGISSQAQVCPNISFPLDGATDIPVYATITWPSVDGISGYIINLGTTPGGTDVANVRTDGQTNSFMAPTGLPENTQIYVSLSLLPFNQPPIVCPGITFNTVDVTSPPPCTILVAPDDNAKNVTIKTEIIWAYAQTATGYRVSIGTVAGGTDILNNQNVGNVLSFDPPMDLPNSANIFVRVTPYNENGDLGPCTEESFSTGAAPYSCEPIVNELTGETISLKPIIDIPFRVGLCGDELPYNITTDDEADGFRWFRANDGTEETLISEARTVSITGPGRYRYEAYNVIIDEGRTIECADFRLFQVAVSALAVIDSIGVVFMEGTQQITISANGIGDYEYALDNSEGPYQDSPIFEMVPLGSHMAYVRDKKGCGIAERTVDRDLSSKDFPKYFTPNGDGIHDYWQFQPPLENFELSLETIFIYDRYGVLVYQLDPKSEGWDGTFQGLPLPSSDYWFKAIPLNSSRITGHFSLKR